MKYTHKLTSGMRWIAYPLGALLVLLMVFQLVLRPGVRFY